MTTWFHAAILATGVVATAAVGLASASAYKDEHFPLAQTTDRLAYVASSAVSNAPASGRRFFIGTAILRMPISLKAETGMPLHAGLRSSPPSLRSARPLPDRAHSGAPVRMAAARIPGE